MARPDSNTIAQEAIDDAHKAWAAAFSDIDLGHEVVLVAERMINRLAAIDPLRREPDGHILREAASRLSGGVWPKQVTDGGS